MVFLKSRKEGQTFYCNKGQVISGYTIGILVLDVWYPLLPGDIANAYTFSFPVRHKMIKGANQERVLKSDKSLVKDIIEASKELELDGVRAICGACGYLGNFQREVAEEIEIPIFLSSLIQIPFIKTGLKNSQKIGIICADGSSLTENILNNCGIENKDCLVIKGLESFENFSAILHSDRGYFDNNKIRDEVVNLAVEMVNKDPDIGAILLECSDLPPYSADVQQAINLPVFDFVTMINIVHNSVAQKPYYGFI